MFWLGLWTGGAWSLVAESHTSVFPKAMQLFYHTVMHIHLQIILALTVVGAGCRCWHPGSGPCGPGFGYTTNGEKRYAGAAWLCIKEPHTQGICTGNFFCSQLCNTIWFIRLCLRSTSISWLAWTIALKGTVADSLFTGVRTAKYNLK